MSKNNFPHLEEALQYHFKNQKLLLTALTHRSFSKNNYERLEFLGDSVLSVVIAKYLFSKAENLKEGELSRMRSSLVNQQILFEVANKIQLAEYVILGAGEKNNDIKISIIADILEALIAAIYLDSNDFNVIDRVIITLFKDFLTNKNATPEDAKTKLQELLQSKKMALPEYKIIAENGAAHDRIFTIECNVRELNLTATATAKTKKEAGQQVATKLITMIYDKIHPNRL